MSVFGYKEEHRHFSFSENKDDVLSFKLISFIAGTSVLAIAAVVALFMRLDLKWGVVFDDPASHFGLPAFAGAFSYLGIMALIATAAVCLFAFGLRGMINDHAAGTLGLVGFLSVLLSLDDLFLLHEGVLRHTFGINELFVFGVYGAIGLTILFRLGPDVAGRRYAGLWMAILLLAAMTVADKAEKTVGTTAWLLLFEETAKLCGFALWAAFWIAFARTALLHRE